VETEAELRAEILRQTMREIDRAALNGAGGNEPTGLLNDGALQVLAGGTNGAAPTWAQLVEAEFQVGTRTREMRSPTWITSPALRKKLRTTQRAAGLDFIVNDDARRLLGYDLRSTPLVPDNLVKGTSGAACSALVFGDLAEVYVGFWGPLAVDLLIDGVTQARDGRVKIIARAEVGVAVRNIGAFAAYKDLLSA
jgi:HK97 family phage major capsid protein